MYFCTKINKLKTQCRIYWLEGCKKFCLICLRSTCSPISFNFYLSNTLLFRRFFLPQYEVLSKCVRMVSPVFKWNPSLDCIESSILFWYLLASSSQSIVRSPEQFFNNDDMKNSNINQFREFLGELQTSFLILIRISFYPKFLIEIKNVLLEVNHIESEVLYKK